MLDRRRVQQAASDEAKKLVDAERLRLGNWRMHFLIFVCVCACNREGTSHSSSRVDGRLE
jgi:hypothetical protein